MTVTRFTWSIPTDYFEGMYADDPEPWNFSTSPYEKAKYDATLKALPRERYTHALEVGCSVGVFTRRLGARCASLLALDAVENALIRARARCKDLPEIRFQRCRVPGEWPVGVFDLIVLSEVVYYLDRDDVAALANRVRSSIASEGSIVLVHWLGDTHYPLSGDDATTHFLMAAKHFAKPVQQQRTEAYRLDVLRAD